MQQQQDSKYKREQLLFESNHLQVYEGYELKTQKRVFLKIVDERAFGIFDKSSDQKAKDMIFKTGIELRRLQNSVFGSLSRCNDTRIFTPRVHEISQEGAQTCIVTPGSDFGFLSSYLQGGQYLKEADALLLLKQIALGLIEFHQLNIAHGAVCADNVVVREKGVELNLLCFQAGEFSKSTPEMLEIDKECNSYLAPELLLDPSLPNTKESDMWSLGALLARLLRGRHVFYGSTRKSVFEQICQYEEMMVKCMQDDCNEGKTDFPIFISEAAFGLIRKLMSQNPADRPSAEELILHPLLEGIRIEMRKQGDYPSALPEQMNQGEEKFAVIKESQILNEIDRYIGEEICFGFSKLKSEDEEENSCSLVQFKTIGLEEGAMSEKYLQKLEQFSQIDLKGSCKTIGIRAVVYVPGNQGNSNGSRSASIVIAQDYSNMGTLEQYLQAKKKANVKGLTVANSIRSMHRLLFALSQISSSELLVLGTLHSKSLYIDSGIFRIGEPLGLQEATTNSTTFNQKLRAFDYFANEFKQDMIDNNPRADLRKADIWSFGFLFYRFIFGEPPIFDLQEKPIFPIQTSIEVSDRIKNVISACLIPQIPPRAVWLSLIQTLHDEQLVLGYDFDMSPKQIPQGNNIQADEPGFELFKYRDKGDKLKMKNMLSSGAKLPLDINQLENRNLEESGKYFQNARKGKGKDERQYEMSESTYSNYDKAANDPSLELDQNRQQQQQGFSNSFIDYGDNLVEGDSSLPFKKYPENEDASLVLDEPKRFLDNLRLPKVGRQEFMVPTAGLLVHYNDTEISYQLMKSESSGGENLRIIKIYAKACCVVILFLTLFFRKNLLNSWEAMLNRGDMRSIQISSLSMSSSAGANVITQDIEQFLASKSPDLDTIMQQYGCIDNQQFNSHSPSVIDAVRGGAFFVWAFMCFISAIAIIASRSFLAARIDTLTIWQNYRSNTSISKRTKKYLIPGQIIAHLEFAFVYYGHFQFFNFFYYAVFNPCLGVDTTSDSTPLIFDSTRLVFSGKSGEFITKIMCTIGIFGFLHFSTLVVYSFFPLIFLKYFLHWVHVLLRGCSFLFGCWIMCRLGAFLIFQPTISFDDESLISASLASGEYQAVFGFIPEIIEVILIGLDLLLEFVFLHIGLALDKRQKDTQAVNLNKNTAHSNIRFRRNAQNMKVVGSKMQFNQSKKQPSTQQQPQISVSQAALSVYSRQTKKL